MREITLVLMVLTLDLRVLTIGLRILIICERANHSSKGAYPSSM